VDITQNASRELGVAVCFECKAIRQDQSTSCFYASRVSYPGGVVPTPGAHQLTCCILFVSPGT